MLLLLWSIQSAHTVIHKAVNRPGRIHFAWQKHIEQAGSQGGIQLIIKKIVPIYCNQTVTDKGCAQRCIREMVCRYEL